MAWEKAGDILRDGKKNGYGVPAFNIFNYETIWFAVEAAERAGIPVLIEFYPGFRGFISLKQVAEITKDAASRVKTPVGLHLDHCGDFDTLIQAMQAGFPSVMYDGSALPYEENAANTREVVKTAKALGIDVEGELGHVGSAGKLEDFTDKSKYTEPTDAQRFVEETGVSSLAIAVGNAHGPYAQAPVIDVPRIREASRLTGIPLVLHGGSGIPDDQVRQAVKAGICKMNVATEYFAAYYRAIAGYMKEEHFTDMFAATKAVRPEIDKFLTYKLELMYKA